MITLQKWFSIIDDGSSLDGGKILIGDQYLTILTSEATKYGTYKTYSSSSIIFDPKTFKVYGVEVCDYERENAYRILEGLEMDELAWDGVNFVDLETDEDFIEKMSAIVNQEDYDDRVVVPLNLEEEELCFLMKQAHNHGMTLNEYVEHLLVVLMENTNNDSV